MNKSEIMKILTEINELVGENKFQHYYLFHSIQRTLRENNEINSKWLKRDDKGWILGYCSNFNYNLYGLNYSKTQLNSVIRELDFRNLPEKIAISGNKELVEAIISAYPNASLEIYKERYFYETNQTKFLPLNDNNIIIRKANISDLDILAKFGCDFFEDEYQGSNNKTISEIKLQLQSSIDNEKIIVAEGTSTIHGYCTRMDTMFGNEMIGTVFVPKTFRERKYGSSLLSNMTKTILSENPKSWLMTDVNNEASNRLVTRLGYNKIFHYTSGELINPSSHPQRS